MVNYKTKTDKYGNTLVEYEVLQGDTFQLSISLKSDGQDIDLEMLSSVVFKISDEDYNEVYNSEFEYEQESGRFLMSMPSEETAKMETDTSYIYEIQVTFVDGTVVSPTQSKIKFKQQIIEEE